MSAALAGLLDFFIAMIVMGGLMIWYQFIPNISFLLFPFLVGLTFLCAVGSGLWLSALNVQYRDIRYVIPFLIQLWMFVSPVIYPVSMAKGKYFWLFLFNPMSGLIKAYRACILGHQPIDWPLLGLSTAIIFLISISGLYYFRRMEKVFADVV